MILKPPGAVAASSPISGVTLMLWRGDAKVFKKYSQMKLQMKREALEKINRQANEQRGFDTVKMQ
jgi:hypothetical protein